MTTIESVAKAIGAVNLPSIGWHDLMDGEREFFTDEARAAIDVLKPLLVEARALLTAQASDLSMGSPVMELCDRIEEVIGPVKIVDVIRSGNSRYEDSHIDAA